MKSIFNIFCYFLLMTVSLTANPQSTDFSQKSKPKTVKVLLHRQDSDILLEVKGRHYIYNPLDGTQISSGILSKRYPLLSDTYGIHWGEKYPFHQLRVVPGDSQSSILINGIQYRGCIEIYHTDGKFNVINEIDVESYLKSTLSSTFPTPFHEEVLSAVAILSRTNAYYLSEKNKQAFWNVTAGETGYQGLAILPLPHIVKAVDNTRQAILLFNGSPFAALWTQNSAGKTADFSSVFRKAITSPPGVTAPLAAKDREKNAWNCSTSRTVLSKVVDLNQITGIDLYLTPQSEKVYAIKITGGNQVKDYDFLTFQKIIGPELLSNDFKVQIKGDQIVFTGYGEGPGVGLCLYSAKLMAEKGKKASEILQTFFPHTTLEKQ